MVVKACRYFGQTTAYWEDQLTFRLLNAQEKELALRPPAEWFLAVYFEAQGWWRPPRFGAEQVSSALPESSLPEYEP